MTNSQLLFLVIVAFTYVGLAVFGVYITWNRGGRMSDCEKCTYNNAGKFKTNCIHPRIHTASGIHDCRHYRPSVGKLESENAKLRQQLADVTESMGRVEERCAKLRELCSELEQMAESNDPDFLHWPEIHDEMRELGIEVKSR